MSLVATMRPKLQADTFYIPTAQGVSFRNRQDSFELRGSAIYGWIEKLVPYLNGHYTVAEITQGLDPQKQAWVSSLLEMLQAHHCIKDVSQDHPHMLTSSEEESYADAIAYIDSFQDSAAYRFECFRERRVLIIGSGHTHTALTCAMLERGIHQVVVLQTQECATDAHRYQEYLALRRTCDPRQTLTKIADPDWQDEAALLAVIEPFDAILHISDRPMLERAMRLNRLCFTQKKLLLQAMIVDTHAWIGPLKPEDRQGCWECAWLRLQARLPDEPIYATFQDHPTSSVSYMVALPTAALVANLLSFELFKYYTEAGPQEIAGNLLCVDLALPHIEKRPFLSHPLCGTCSSAADSSRIAFLEHIHHLESQVPLDEDFFPRHIAPCFEEYFGLFSSLDPRDYATLPVSVCRATMSRLPELTGREKPLLLAAVGMGFYQARRRLMQRACELYAANLVDRRRLVSTEKALREDKRMYVDRFLSGEDLTEVKEWIWALQMHTAQACLVPASLVFPVMRDQTQWNETGPGVASGMSWAEAICQALLNWCKQLTIAQIGCRKEPYSQTDIGALLAYAKNTLQRRWFSRAKDIASIYDVTGILQVPTFAFCISGKTIVYSTHFDPVEALSQGFIQMMQQFQAVRDEQPECALAPVPALPETLQGDMVAVPKYSCPQEWPLRQQWLQERLSQLGWQAFVIPLDHDPALTTLFPYIVQVLLGRI